MVREGKGWCVRLSRFGFGIGGGCDIMGDRDVEEGEASGCMDNDDNVDIDEALSYIGNRIQDLLGHHQKDFECGLSAETLGARYGGYGSFLPTYQRSPSIWSNPTTRPKVQNQGLREFSHVDKPVEGASQKSVSLHETTLLPRPKAPLSSASPQPLKWLSPEDRSVKVRSASAYISDHEPVEVLANQSEQKALKVRIKVGSDNCLLAKKNEAIYSNLGLGMSPCSSSEDNESLESEMDFPDSLKESTNSPSCIVRIMTSAPIPSGAMLSPLRSSLANLLEQRDSLDHNRTRAERECSALLVDEQVPGKKKKQRSVRLVESKNKNNDSSSSLSAYLKNETNIETSKDNHILTDVANHSPESNKATNIRKVGNGTSTVFKANATDAKMELFSQKKACKIHEVSAKPTLTGKVHKDKKLCRDPRDDGNKGDRSLDLCEENHDIPEGMRECRDELLDVTEQKFGQKKTSYLQDEIKASHRREQLSAGKTNPEGSKYDSSSAARTSNNNKRISLSTKPKVKIFENSCLPSKNKEDVALLKDSRKVKVKDSVSIGDRITGKYESRSHLLGTSDENEAWDHELEVSEKPPLAISNKLKVTTRDKKASFLSTSKTDLRRDIDDVIQLAGVRPKEIAPVLIEENWVCCDKCHKWRLLPYGTNPNNLPKKWLCSMLNWLPQMNRCSFSEEETTNALYALYQVPVPGNHNYQPTHSVTAGTLVTLINAQHDVVQNPHDLSSSGGKKKHETKEVSNLAQHRASQKPLKSTMKNEEASLKRRSLQNVKSSSLEIKLEKRSGIPQSEKKFICPGIGNAQPLKIKSRTEADQEGFKLSKKVRTDNMQYADEDHKTGRFSKKEIENESRKYSQRPSSRVLQHVAKDSAILCVEEPNDQVRKTMATKDPNVRDAVVKKRKNNPSQLTANDKILKRRDSRDGLQCMEASSSSSMISGTCKFKINFQRIKGSPVESVCSSPLRISNQGSPRRSSPGILGGIDGGFSHVSGQARCLEGEVVGNWSETERKEISFSLTHCKDEVMTQRMCNKVTPSASHSSRVTNLPLSNSRRDIYDHNSKCSIEALHRREDNQFGSEVYGESNRKMDSSLQQNYRSAAQHNVLQDDNNIGCLDFLPSGRTDEVEIAAGRGKSLDLSSSDDKKENRSWKDNENDALDVDASSCDALARAPGQHGKNHVQNALQGDMLRHPSLDRQESKDIVSSHKIRNDFFSWAANDAIKGANNRMHPADCLKISASGLQSTELFFQVALKFLHLASDSTPHNNKNANKGEMTSTEMYGNTAKLCEYCASEFERCNDMASAALAYKCMEVAYMWIVYSNDLIASKDINVLQMELQRVSSVESPSSSTSDVVNVSNEIKEKKCMAKDVGRSQVARDHVIAARNQNSFVRLLKFAQDVDRAMEASRRSQAAFAAAEKILAETDNTEGISSIRKVLDIGFHDVEGLLQLIQLAMASKTP